jgi:hypothetical protein
MTGMPPISVSDYNSLFINSGVAQALQAAIAEATKNLNQNTGQPSGDIGTWLSNFGQSKIDRAMVDNITSDKIIGEQIKWVGDSIHSGHWDLSANPLLAHDLPSDATRSAFEFGGAAAANAVAGAIAIGTAAAVAFELDLTVGAAIFMTALLGPEIITALGIVGASWLVGFLITQLSNNYGPGYLGKGLGDAIFDWFNHQFSPLNNWLGLDPLVIDLNHNGYDLTALGNSATGSQVHFDYGNDGFAERTGWVSPTDGILVHDKNGNGLVDDASELFGSTNVDGFDVLALMDTNADGKIDASDAKFSELRIWQDLNGNGAVDAGEMHTLVEMGITSISLARSKSTLTINGNTIGYESLVTFADGSTTTAGTAYMKTDGQNTLRPDNTPSFTMGQDVDKLPQLPGSGLINSTTWKRRSRNRKFTKYSNFLRSISFIEMSEPDEACLSYAV